MATKIDFRGRLKEIRERLLGHTLIDIEHDKNTLTDMGGTTNLSEELILHFDDGSQLEIWGNGTHNSTIYVQED